jgi:uncharacterized protein (DUF924 family)
MARVYPDRERALRHLRYKQAVYRFGRFPQRYVLGIDQSFSDGGLRQVPSDALARP